MIIDKLIEKIKLTNNPSVIGLDTCFDYLPEDMQVKCNSLKDVADQITKFNFDLVDVLKNEIPAVKDTLDAFLLMLKDKNVTIS